MVHIWTPDVAPQISFLDFGKQITFYDYFYIWRLQLGDRIKLYHQFDDKPYEELGEFEVVGIRAAELEGYPDELRQILAKEV